MIHFRLPTSDFRRVHERSVPSLTARLHGPRDLRIEPAAALPPLLAGQARVRIGSVVLGKLPLGQWRYLRADESF